MGPAIFGASQTPCRRWEPKFGESPVVPSPQISMLLFFLAWDRLAIQRVIFRSKTSLDRSGIGWRRGESFWESALATSSYFRQVRSRPGWMDWDFWKAMFGDSILPALRFRRSGGTV